MKNFDLEHFGVVEMNQQEMKQTDGGHMVGYAEWYKQQQQDEINEWIESVFPWWL